MKRSISTLIQSSIMALAALIVAVIIAMLPTVREGLELLYLLPLSMSIVFFLFRDIFSKWKSSIGLSIIFASCLLRYIIAPLLMSLSQHTVVYINASSSSYRLAIAAMIFELYIFFGILKFFYIQYRIKSYRLTEEYEQEKSQEPFRVTWLGWIMCFAIVFMLISRGHLDNVFSHFSFLTNYSVDYSDVYTYDRTFVYLMKSFLFITIVSKLKEISDRNTSVKPICLMVSIAAAFINIALYDHTSRSVLVEIIVSSVAVLSYCFPKNKKLFVILFGIGGFALVSTVFLIGTLQTTWTNLGTASTAFYRIAEISELYGNGVSTMAHAIDTYSTVGASVDASTLFSGIVNSIGFITFPGFRNIYYMTANVPTAAALFLATLRGKGFILPPFGIALYYGGVAFSIPISILNSIICVAVFFGVILQKQRRSYSTGMVYVITYAEIICGMSFFVNNISIMFSSLTQIPLLLLLMLKINNLGNRIVIRRK